MEDCVNNSENMLSVGVLLKQLKQKEDRDLAYAKQIKEAEKLLKDKQDTLKKLKIQQKKLSEEVRRKRFRCSEKEMTKLMLQHQKQIWKDLLHEAQRDSKEEEAKLDELQQSVFLDRLDFYNEIKDFLGKHELINSSNAYCSEPSLSVLTGTKVKIENYEDDYESLMEEMMTLENQLEELKAEEFQIDEAKKIKGQLEAEPSCGEEFLSTQKLLKEAKDNLRNAEEEVINLKMEIAQKELLILNKRYAAPEVKPANGQVLKEKACDAHLQTKKSLDVTKNSNAEGMSSAPKTVTFKSTVDVKQIPSSLKNTSVLNLKNRTKSPSAALRNKLAQTVTSQLDEKMRDILFKDKN